MKSEFLPELVRLTTRLLGRSVVDHLFHLRCLPASCRRMSETEARPPGGGAEALSAEVPTEIRPGRTVGGHWRTLSHFFGAKASLVGSVRWG